MSFPWGSFPCAAAQHVPSTASGTSGTAVPELPWSGRAVLVCSGLGSEVRVRWGLSVGQLSGCWKVFGCRRGGFGIILFQQRLEHGCGCARNGPFVFELSRDLAAGGSHVLPHPTKWAPLMVWDVLLRWESRTVGMLLPTSELVLELRPCRKTPS